jgi:hypothetical protein
LVTGAILGYFFTVRPVYQKQLLDEQIAERTVLLKEATARLSLLTTDETKLREENNRLSIESERVYKQLRSNLSFEMLRASLRCFPYSDSSSASAASLQLCIWKFVGDQITKNLRAGDQVVLNALLETRKSEFIAKVDAARTKAVSESKGAMRKHSQAEAKLKKLDRDLDINLRALREKTTGKAVVDRSELKELQSAEETNVYLKYIEDRNSALADLLGTSHASSDEAFSIRRAMVDVADKLMEEMRADFRAKVER